jgi:hypothetical protein
MVFPGEKRSTCKAQYKKNARKVGQEEEEEEEEEEEGVRTLAELLCDGCLQVMGQGHLSRETARPPASR